VLLHEVIQVTATPHFCNDAVHMSHCRSAVWKRKLTSRNARRGKYVFFFQANIA